MAIRYVKGVGPQRADLLARLGIETIEDALFYPPRRYEDRRQLLPINRLSPGELATVRATVRSKRLRRGRRGQSILEAAFEDASGVLQGVWFHQPYLAVQLKVGAEFILHGRIEAGKQPQMIHPELEQLDGEDDASIHTRRIVPIYPLTSRIGQRWFRTLTAGVVERHASQLADPLPVQVRQEHGWPGLESCVRQLHFPDAWDALELAKRRLAFEELFLLQLLLAQRRDRVRSRRKAQRYQLDGPLTQGLRAALPFTLTASQERVLQELFADLARSGPMHRLLQGDVGCGKTIVLIMLLAAAVQSGYQAALMAPTELLAEQHARVVGAYLAPLGVSVGLLSQGVPAAERKRRLGAIAKGRLSVVIGTHAMIQRRVAFERLALVIIDEQHKFGVSQRGALARKAVDPDVLVLTATPIPRTLALSLYGDLDASTIGELPPGRQPVRTIWMQERQRQDAYAMIGEQLAQGRQGYVVYPLVEEEEARDVKAATQMAKRLKTEVFPDVKVGLLHGRMRPEEKERAMRAFAEGRVRLLVSTVIVEVGLDVTTATIMLIEHAERFGLAQLHQLRGRIGRGEQAATCLALSDTTDETARRRLEAFVGTTDGFALAETDLELRGPGQLLGKLQHGWLRFRMADLARDHSLLESARRQAIQLIEQDPELAAPSLAELRQRLARAVRARA